MCYTRVLEVSFDLRENGINGEAAEYEPLRVTRVTEEGRDAGVRF
jgi:hypothetical protein